MVGQIEGKGLDVSELVVVFFCTFQVLDLEGAERKNAFKNNYIQFKQKTSN